RAFHVTGVQTCALPISGNVSGGRAWNRVVDGDRRRARCVVTAGAGRSGGPGPAAPAADPAQVPVRGQLPGAADDHLPDLRRVAVPAGVLPGADRLDRLLADLRVRQIG